MRYPLGYTLFYILTLVPSTAVTVAFATRYLRVQRRGLFIALWSAMFLVKAVLVYTVLGQSYLANAVITCGSFLIQILLQILFGTCRWYLRVVYFFVHIVVDTISELLLSLAFTLLYGDMSLFFSGQPQYLVPIFAGRVICLLLLTAGLTLIYNHVWLRLDREASEKAISPMLLFLCSQWLCFGCLMVFANFSSAVPTAMAVCAVILVLGVAGDVLLLRTVRRLGEAYRMEQSLALADERMRFREQQYQTLQDGIDRTRRLRHDFNNHAQTLGYLLGQGRTAEFISQLDSLEERLFDGYEAETIQTKTGCG